jgi:hypothetical protein
LGGGEMSMRSLPHSLTGQQARLFSVS